MKKIIFAFYCLLTFTASVLLAGSAGYKTFQMGDTTLVALQDSIFEAPSDILIGADAEDVRKAEKADGFKLSVNAYILKISGKTLLFDAGTGDGLIKTLETAKIKPEDVDLIILTHTHFDHTGALVKDGGMVFPNAELWVSKTEFENWSGGSKLFAEAYGSKLKTFEAGSEIIKGVKSIDSNGHTPGHASFMIGGGKDSFIIAGDLVHVGILQFANPDIALKFDSDTTAAIASRKRIFEIAAEKNIPIAFMHVRFPGIGTLKKDGSQYVFTPINK